MKIYEAIKKGTDILESNNIQDSRLKSRMLMQNFLDKSKEELVLHSDMEYDFSKYFEQIEKLSENIPLEYVIGKTSFFGYEIIVNENVLIPRLDSEILVSETVKKIKEIYNLKKAENLNSDYKIKVLEIGVGSGALLVAINSMLKSEQIFVEFVGVDISEEALKLSEKNLTANNCMKNVKLINSDVFSELVNFKFDIIYSNPPYIRSEEISKLDKEVQKEPLLALDGGKDGLIFYKKIIKDAFKFTKEKYLIIFEIGFDQASEIEKLANELINESKFKNLNNYVVKDFENRDRVFVLQNL